MWERKLETVLSWLWPQRCASCDVTVPVSRAFCLDCHALIVPDEPACPRCANPLRDGFECPCRQRRLEICTAVCALPYGGPVTAALLRFKHGNRRDLGRPLGTILGQHLTAMGFWHRLDGLISTTPPEKAPKADPILLAPVPLHPRRLRQRGYNQALELARQIRAMAVIEHPTPDTPKTKVERGGRPAVPIRLVPDLLLRILDTPALGHMGAVQRQDTVAGAFAAHKPHRIRGAHVVLVDDVMTTGATLSACARVLLDAGAAQVYGAALARAGGA